MARLGRAIVVDERPAGGRPAVVEHPINQPGGEPLAAAEQLHGKAYPFILDILHFKYLVKAAFGRAEELGGDCAQVIKNFKFPEGLRGVGFGVVAPDGVILPKNVLFRHETAQGGDLRRAHHRLLRTEAGQKIVEVLPVIQQVVKANVPEPIADVIGVVRGSAGDGAIRRPAVWA